MIITCPACATSYDVPESAIGEAGRTVRCAKCQHSWFQDGATAQPELPPFEAPVHNPIADAVQPAGKADAPPPPSSPSPPVSPGPAVRSAPAETVADVLAEAIAAEQELAMPRRGRSRLWLAAACVFIILALGIGAAAYRYGLPDWLPIKRPTFAATQPGLVLDFPPDRLDRRTLADGTEFFGASGTITNVGGAKRRVPPLLIVLRDDRQRVVYRWEVIPPRRQLGPGETMQIKEAVTDVPPAARLAQVGWKPG